MGACERFICNCLLRSDQRLVGKRLFDRLDESGDGCVQALCGGVQAASLCFEQSCIEIARDALCEARLLNTEPIEFAQRPLVSLGEVTVGSEGKGSRNRSHELQFTRCLQGFDSL